MQQQEYCHWLWCSDSAWAWISRNKRRSIRAMCLSLAAFQAGVTVTARVDPSPQLDTACPLLFSMLPAGTLDSPRRAREGSPVASSSSHHPAMFSSPPPSDKSPHLLDSSRRGWGCWQGSPLASRWASPDEGTAVQSTRSRRFCPPGVLLRAWNFVSHFPRLRPGAVADGSLAASLFPTDSPILLLPH